MIIDTFTASEARDANIKYWENYFHDNADLHYELIEIFGIIEKAAKRGDGYINYSIKGEYIILFRKFLTSCGYTVQSASATDMHKLYILWE